MRPKEKNSQFYSEFQKPGAAYRGAPFWAWNGDLQPEHLREQIRLMKKMGLGGFFMHSRTGLETPYLGEKWFQCVDACVDEAKKQGMWAWLYDEDRWPSGAAGGRVTENDAFKSRHIYCAKGEAPEGGNVLARFALKLKNEKVMKATRLALGEQPEKKQGELYTFYWKYAPCTSWFNGETYVDTMNPEAIQQFIKLTHEAYAKRYAKEFGKTIPGIFTDEPSLVHGKCADCAPWTGRIPELFQKRYGYDLLDVVYELFYDTPRHFSQVRYHFYDLICDLFTQVFAKTIFDWCEKNHLPLTGHQMGEDFLSIQALYSSAAMPFYEFEQWPGIDMLTEHWNIFNTIKQCTSMAHQFGRNRRLSETYGCTGWDFPFEGHKAIGDFQYALGINYRCLHLAWYTMAGEAKRDYPACISYHSPWYEKYTVVEDYFARLGAILSQGEEIRDLLVVHPIESLWGVFIKESPEAQAKSTKVVPLGCKGLNCFDVPEINHLDDQFSSLTNLLLEENLDFDLGDEKILAKFGKCKDSLLQVGKGRYSVVLLPEMKTIRSTTLALLKKFKGDVFYLGKAPEYVDGAPSDEAQKAYQAFIKVTRRQLASRIEESYRRVAIWDQKGKEAKAMLYRLSDCGKNGYVLFLCNTSVSFTSDIRNAPFVRERTIEYPQLDVAVALPYSGLVYELDPTTGKATLADFEYETSDDGSEFYHIFTSACRLQSRLFWITDQPVKAESTQENQQKNTKKKTCIDEPMEYCLSEDNVLVLDHFAWKLEGEPKHPAQYVMTVDDEVRQALGEAPRGGRMVQPWHQLGKQWASRHLELSCEFECDALPKEDCKLVMEFPEFAKISINGKPLKQVPCGFWCDESLKALLLPRKLLKTGKNTFQISLEYNCGMKGLEAIFILGRFGVKNQTITSLPEKLSFGDWCEQGLPNYAGNVTYRCQVNGNAKQSVKLSFPEWKGVLLGIKVNQKKEQLLPWPPYECCVPGNCTVEITVYGHRRNAFGPFYTETKWPDRSSPAMFKLYQQSQRQLVPVGLLVPPVLE